MGGVGEGGQVEDSSILVIPPAVGSIERQREYFDWAKSVIDRVQGANV
jgi:hypothetical protein